MRSSWLGSAPPLLVALLAFGCDDAGVASDTSDLTMSKSVTLRFTEAQDGALTLKVSGRTATCDARFEGLAGERVTCARDGERLQVILKEEGGAVVVRDLGGKRGYYACTTSEHAGDLPGKLACKLTPLRARGTGGLSSPFDSTVDDVGLLNAHWVDAKEKVLRGMEPRTPEEFDELRALGVSKVVIFKNATGKDDVGEETAAWSLPSGAVLHVPFAWKDLPPFTTSCKQTLEALRFVRTAEQAGERVFFHCTVGEDRTGYLAALYDVAFADADPRRAFELDMCEHGYERGNPQKPGFVTGKLEDGLTPLYRQMAFLASQGKLAELDDKVCASPPEVPADFLDGSLSCGVSTLLVP